MSDDDIAKRAWIVAGIAAGLGLALIVFWPALDPPPAEIIESTPVANLYTWNPGAICSEGFAALKIHLEPSPGADHETIFTGCGVVLTGDETYFQGDFVDLVVR